MRRFLIYGTLFVLLCVGGAAWWAYHAAHTVPLRYQQVLASADPQRQAAASTEMFNRSQRLLQQTKKPGGAWKAVFTAEQINGFLAVDLPKQLQGAVRQQVQDPRVVIEGDHVTLYCRVEHPNLSAVVSIEVEPFVPAERDTVGLRVVSVNAGSLPLPLGKVQALLAQAASQSSIPLRWSEEDGDPVALITLPTTKQGRQVELETLEVHAGSQSGDDQTGGEIRLAGRTRR
jgi:hypothetical protein